MTIIYRDEVGIVSEDVDSFGIDFLDGKATFNDKEIDVSAIICIN